MEFLDSYFEDEVRDGFYIPSMVKRGWAAELEVLAEIDRICTKYNIKYYAEWGSLLGTVRHQGFIPWDDDLDIGMMRKDYKRFLEVADKEFNGKFTLFTYNRHSDFWYFLARVVGNTQICFEEEHLNRFHQFPYIAGVDIFILDNVSNDEKKEKDRNTIAKYIIEAADEICTKDLSKSVIEKYLSTIESLCMVTIPQEMKFYMYDNVDKNKNKAFNVEISVEERKYRLRVYLYGLAEKLFEAFENEECEYLTQLMPAGLYGNGYKLKKKYFDKIIRLPFENTTMPVPAAYDEMLRMRYGDYMKIIKNRAGHDYPFFDTQQKQLDEVLKREGVEGLKGYEFDINAIERQKQERLETKQNSYKELTKECFRELLNIYDSIKESFYAKEAENVMSLLADSQQLGIDLGNLIENIKGEGFVTVTHIQEYCEKIFTLYGETGANVFNEKTLEDVYFSLTKIEESINSDILGREEVVFVVSHFDKWKYIRRIWQYYNSIDSYDVKIIVIPYYYKKYDGSFYKMEYRGEEFQKELDIVKYDEYDFGLRFPEKIIIQSPYDSFDPVVSEHTYFYSDNLKKYTDELIYVQPFEVDDFDDSYYCEYLNMKYYCTVPGVVNSDTVVLNSEKVKKVYIEKLTEFAGENTRIIWEEKIKVYSDVYVNLRGEETCQNEENHKHDYSKKAVLYYTGVSGWIQYGVGMINKIKDVLDVFEKNKDNIEVIWKTHPMTEQIIMECCSDVYDDYKCIVEKFKEAGFGSFADSEKDEELVEKCCAYYGDSEAIIRKFQRAGKPVMIQNIEILSFS